MMSDGVQHVAGASFFPTAREVANGIQWCKDHPILAAAAATAISAFTYWNANVSTPPNMESTCSGSDKAILSTRTNLPLKLNRRHSSNGMSSTNVSWGDECGGNLTHVIEDRARSVSECSDLEKKELHDDIFSPKTIKNSNQVGKTNDVIEKHQSAIPAPEDGSPQWGWYVAITPPQDSPATLQQMDISTTGTTMSRSSLKRSVSGKIY